MTDYQCDASSSEFMLKKELIHEQSSVEDWFKFDLPGNLRLAHDKSCQSEPVED
jgi:hypothetical protein